jgi:ABC-type multidrug transport system ATPase subunit
MTVMLRATGLSKRFDATVAFAGVDLQAAAGECVGLVGPNGSGRSTLLKVLATLLRPSSGSLEVDGVDAARVPYEARRRLIYVGDPVDLVVPGHGLTVREYLDFVASARRGRMSRTTIDDTLARAGLRDDADVDTLSAGTRRRVSLAAAFLLAPRVLLLDDPFAALDADARLTFSRWLCEVRDAGTTTIAALNDERDVRALCHRMLRLECAASEAERVTALPATAAV